MLVDYDGAPPAEPSAQSGTKTSSAASDTAPAAVVGAAATSDPRESKDPGSNDKDDVFSDSEAEEGGSSKSKRTQPASSTGETVTSSAPASENKSNADQVATVTRATEQVSLGNSGPAPPKSDVASSTEFSTSESEFKAMAADASVFTFGDEEDYESD